MNQAHARDLGLLIKIRPGYQSDALNLCEEEKAGRKILENIHKALITMGRLCWMPALGFSIASLLTGNSISPNMQELMADASKIGWQLWGINIASRSVAFYLFGNSLTKATTVMARHLPRFTRERQREELQSAITWKAYKNMSEATGKTVFYYEDTKPERAIMEKKVQTSFLYRNKLIKEYRNK